MSGCAVNGGETVSRAGAVASALAGALAGALALSAPVAAHAAPARADCAGPTFTQVAPVRIGGVAPDGSLTLDDGRRFVVENIVVPTRLEPVDGLAEAAARAGMAAVEGHPVLVSGTATDRHGRTVGQARLTAAVEGRVDLAAVLVAAGAAYATGDGPCAAALLAVEAEARGAGRGLWKRAGAVAAAGDERDMARRRGLHAVAEGRILAVGVRRDRTYLNFGETWRRDFTVMVRTSDFATILGHGQDPAMLRGALVRVRGVVREQGGPAIMVQSQAGIERLGERTGSEERR
ncbi:thermonuclease family protein [Xanthobacter sp. V4C-4]|uniref:thermonuclease family protein n=1 Tax=Xanthobacter cornucopiae TaxID=3119924 RepID=UPI003729DD73